jgi:hypothetical protein
MGQSNDVKKQCMTIDDSWTIDKHYKLIKSTSNRNIIKTQNGLNDLVGGMTKTSIPLDMAGGVGQQCMMKGGNIR